MTRKLKLGMSGISPDSLVSKSVKIEEAMTANANFPNPDPALANVTAKRQELESWIAKAKFGDSRAREKRDILFAELSTMLRDLAGYISFIAKGDKEVIISSGFEVAKLPEPVGQLNRPASLSAVSTQIMGQVGINWAGVKGARTYFVEYAEETADGGVTTWMAAGVTSKSMFVIDNLLPGKSYSFRVKAIGAGQMHESGYSDPARVMAA